MKVLAFALLLIATWSQPVYAEWSLDNSSSRLSFVSTKAQAAAEVHKFGTLDGRVDENGKVTLTVELDSVDTAIEIRDTRMREMLFETDSYPTATLVASIDMAALENLEVGASTDMVTEGQLQLHGTTVSLTVNMTVARLGESRVMAVSRSPLIVNASQVGLLDGVERLREVAGLPSISPAVPVTFVLAFDKVTN